MKYKKTLVAFSLFIMLSVGLVFAFNFGTLSSSNTKIVYGAQAAETDKVGARDINDVFTDETSTSITILGNESFLIRAHGNDLNFGEALDSIINKLTYKDLPGILKQGEVEYDSGSDEDYTQILKFGANTISFDSLDNEDYMDQDSFESSRQTPVPYLDLNGNLWNLIIEFDDPLDMTDLDNDATINIAGKEYYFAPNIEEGDNEVVLYASTRKIILELNQPQIVEIGGESVTLEVIGTNNDGDRVFIKFDDDFEKIRENEAVSINGEKVYVNDILAYFFTENYKVTAELFIGAEELTLEINGGFNTVEVNGDNLEGLEVKITGSINATEEIEFQFSPMEMDDIEDELEFLELGEKITDPLFGTISLFFDSITTMFDSESRDLIEIDSTGDELDVKFNNVDGNEIDFTPYYLESNALMSNLVSGTVGFEDEIFIVQVAGDITEVFKIEDINTDDVEIYSYSEDDSKDYENGDELEGDTGIIIDFINNTDKTVTFNQPSSNILHTENKMVITLNSDNITFDEVNLDNDESSTIGTIVTISIINNTADIEIGSVNGVGITSRYDDDSDYEYTLTDGYATYFVKEANDDSNLKVYVPEEETDFNVYISNAITKTTEDAEDLTITDVGSSGTENIIVIGGSCINQVAAELLGSASCSEEFTTLTGVSAGQYLYQVFDNPDTDGIAVLIAGYNAEDTVRGVKEYLEGDFSLEVGTKLIN